MPRIYVSNLAEAVTRDDLRALFSKSGTVRVRVSFRVRQTLYWYVSWLGTCSQTWTVRVRFSFRVRQTLY